MASPIVSTLNKLMLLPVTQRRLHQKVGTLRHVQFQKLERVLWDAWEKVPLYRDKFDKAGVHPSDLRTTSDLTAFPITTKDEIRDNFPDGVVRRGTRLDDVRIQQTSGSSGQCMEIALDSWSDDQRALFTQRVYGLIGFRAWRRMAYLFPYELPLRKNLGLYRNRHISTQLPPEQMWQALREWRPHLLAATPSDLFDLCDGVDDDLRELDLLGISVHSEPMSADERKHIEQRFGCPVSTNYYCNEVWAIAAECRAGGLHQFLDNVVVEIVDANGWPVERGQTGRVLVTSLHNYVQPFIRYELGDLAAWDRSTAPCPCGLELPRLMKLEGRDDDWILLPDGTRLHPSKLTVAVKSPCFDHPGAQIYRDYRIAQTGPRDVSIQIVPGRDRAQLEACTRASVANLEKLLGPDVTVKLELRNILERGDGGKRKIVERLVATEEKPGWK